MAEAPYICPGCAVCSPEIAAYEAEIEEAWAREEEFAE